MRHLKIPGQNIRNLSLFKTQVSALLRDINNFSESDKAEALTYLESCIRSLKMQKESEPGPVTEVKKVKNHLEENAISCKLCSAERKTKADMLKHLQTHEGTPLSCLRCKCTFSGSVAYDWHLNNYCKSKCKKFKCQQCSKMCITKMHLEQHLRGHKRNNCKYCEKVFTRRNQLGEHLLRVHSVKMERRYHPCNICDKKFGSKVSLNNHLKLHAKYICNECGKISEIFEKHEEHVKAQNERKHFKCTKCDEIFSRRHRYLVHLSRHNVYKCTTCSKTFASKVTARVHKQEEGHHVNGVEPKFICPYCPQVFYRQNQLHYHLIKKHSDNNLSSVTCKFCNKLFKSLIAYYKHCIAVNHEKYSINNEKCEICGQNFVRKHELNQHMYKIHNQSKEVQCEHCSYRTTNKCNLKRHVSSHFKSQNQFICEHCLKGCDSLSSLKDHILYNHVKERQHQCDACNKSFKRKSELIRHKSIHSDDRPHQCNLCDKSYKRQSHLKRHEKMEHKIISETRRLHQVEIDNECQEESALLENVGIQEVANTKISESNSLTTGEMVDELVSLIVKDEEDLVECTENLVYLTFVPPNTPRHRLILPKSN